MENMASSSPTEEELLRALDDIDVIPERARKPGKRSSILKQPKNTEDVCLTEDLNKRKSNSKRRVSFADKFQVMELCSGNIYDVPGKSVSSSDSAINPDISSEAKSEAASEQVSRIQVQASSSSNDFEMRCQEYTLTNNIRKHKMDSVDDTEPERKKLNILERSSIGNVTSVQSMVEEFNNYMCKFSQNDQETMVNQDIKLTFARSVDKNVDVKQSLILNKTDDRIPTNEFQEALNFPKSQIHEGSNFLSKSFVFNSVFSAANSSNITSNLGDQCVYDIISKQAPNVQLFPVSLSSIPLEENKENIYVDSKNKKVLVTSGRHLKLKEIPSDSDAQSLKPPLEIEELDLKDTDAAVPIKSAVQHLISSDSPSEVQVLKQKEKSHFDKTYLFNQSMDLTCIIPTLDKFHDTESSIQNDFPKPDNIFSSEENLKITENELHNSSSNTFPDSKFKRPNKFLNKTKLNICDMDLTTCYAGSGPVDDLCDEGKSFAKYNPTSEILSVDTKQPDLSPLLSEIVSKESSTDMLTKLECEPILYSSSAKSLMPKKPYNIPTGKENFISSSDILYGKSKNPTQESVQKQKEKLAFDKTILFNQSMDLSGIFSSDSKQSDSGPILPEIVSKENLSTDILTKSECEPVFDSNSIKSLMTKKFNNIPSGKENSVSSSNILYGKSQVQALKQKEKSVLDKTFLFNQSMDLTCIVPESDKLNNSEYSVQGDFPNVKNAASKVKNKANYQEINDPSNVIPALRFNQRGVNINKTKLSTFDMELTCAVNSCSSENLAIEDASFSKFDSTSKISSSDIKHQPVPSSAFSETILKDPLLNISHNNEFNKSAYIPISNSFIAENLAQEKQSVIPLGKENVEKYNCVSFDSKFQNSNIENNKISSTSAPLSLSVMDLTCNIEQSCNDSNIEEVNIRSSHITDLQKDYSFPKMTGNDKSILMHNEKAVDFEQNNKSQLGEMPMELTCHDKVFKSDSLIFSKDSIYNAKTKHFTFDAMELTCLGKNDAGLAKWFVGEKNISTEIGEGTLKRKPDDMDDNDYGLHKISPLDSQKDVSAKDQVGVMFKKRHIANESEFQSSTLMFKNGVCASSTKIFDNASEHYISDLQIEPSLIREKEMSSNHVNAAIKPHSFIFSQTVATQKNATDIRSGQLSNENCAVDEIKLPSDSSSDVLSDKNFLKSGLSSSSLYKLNTLDKATRCFTSDLMELTSKSKWSNPQVLDQTSKNINSVQVGEKTRYFCSDVMELTCDVKTLSNTNSLINDTAALKSHDNNKINPMDYVETLNSCEFSKSKNIGENSSVSRFQRDIDFSVPEIKLTKPSVQDTSSVSCNIECTNCSDIIHKQQTLSKESCEINTPLSIKSSGHANNEGRVGNLEKNNAVVESVSSGTKKMYESAKSGIVYAIKKLKYMNHFSDTDADIFKFPEVFLSLRKQPKPITSFSCTKIELSNAVRNAIRQSCSFNYDGKELSFIAEMDVSQSSTTDKYQRLSRNKETDVSEASVTDAESVFIQEHSESIEHFVKNDTDVISHKRFQLHSSFPEENIELISDSILNDISITRNDTNSVCYKYLAPDHFQKESSKNQGDYDKLNTPAKLNFEVSVGMIATPENIHKTIVLPEEKLYDDHTLNEVFFKGMTNQTQEINKDLSEMRTPTLVAPNIDQSLLNSTKAKVGNSIEDVPNKDGPTSFAQIAFDTTERSNSVKCTLTLPTTSRKDPAPTVIVVPNIDQSVLNSPKAKVSNSIEDVSNKDGSTPSVQIAFDTTERSDSAKCTLTLPTTSREDPASTVIVAANIDKSLLDCSKAKAVNPINKVPKDGPTPSAQIAFDTTERSDSAEYILTLPATSREDPATVAIDDPQLISSSDESDDVLTKITCWRRKFIEASQEKDCLWSFEEIDDNEAVFEIMGDSLFSAYFMRVPLQLNSPCPSGTEISFQHIHDPDEIDELGYFLLMDHLSGHTEISPFSAEELLDKLPIYLDAALKAKSLMKDIALTTIKRELSVDYSQNLPRLKVKIMKGDPCLTPFSIFSLTFPINVKTYPDEKIVPEVEHLKWDKIEEETILDALEKIEPGKNYIRRMTDAVQDL